MYFKIPLAQYQMHDFCFLNKNFIFSSVISYSQLNHRENKYFITKRVLKFSFNFNSDRRWRTLQLRVTYVILCQHNISISIRRNQLHLTSAYAFLTQAELAVDNLSKYMCQRFIACDKVRGCPKNPNFIICLFCIITVQYTSSSLSTSLLTQEKW